MEVTPITGLVFGIEHVENQDWEDPEESWLWCYVFSIGLVRIVVFKYK